MNYKKILKTDNNILILMRGLGLQGESLQVRKINHHPDYDFGTYGGSERRTYVFEDELPTPDELHAIYRAEIVGTRILHWDDIKEVGESLNVDLSGEESFDALLTDALRGNEDLMEQLGYDRLEQFSLNSLKITEIDHAEQCVRLLGSFDGDSYGISQDDWGLYAIFRFSGFKEHPQVADFYRQLLVESFQLRDKNDHRTSCFLAYSAVDGYINRKLGSEGERDRLGEKARELFIQSFPEIPIGKHEIYTYAIDDFKTTLTQMRNDIAHGRRLEVGSAESRHMLLVALILVSSIELKAATFLELFPAP